MPENHKLTLGEALAYLNDAAKKGVQQGRDFARMREAQRLIIAYRVKTQRVEQGYKQEQFSEMLDINPLTYRGYENCKSDIPIVHLVKIANALDVSLDYLTGRTEVTKIAGNDLEERLKRLESMLNPE